MALSLCIYIYLTRQKVISHLMCSPAYKDFLFVTFSGLEKTRLAENSNAKLRNISNSSDLMILSVPGVSTYSDSAESASIMGLCALHGLHNCGSDKDEAKKLVTQWARAPTKAQWQNISSNR